MPIGFFGLLALLLVGLKLAGIITIGWGLVVTIALIPFILLVVLFLLVILVIASAQP